MGAALSILDGWRCRNGHAPAPSDRNQRTMLAKTAATVARPPPPASFIATARIPPDMTGLQIRQDDRWPAVGSAGRADSKQRARLRRAVPLKCNAIHNAILCNIDVSHRSRARRSPPARGRGAPPPNRPSEERGPASSNWWGNEYVRFEGWLATVKGNHRGATVAPRSLFDAASPAPLVIIRHGSPKGHQQERQGSPEETTPGRRRVAQRHGSRCG